MRRTAAFLVILAACGHPRGNEGHDDATPGTPDGSGSLDDGGTADDDGGTDDGGGNGGDGGAGDGGGNATQDAGGMDAPEGIITGGPCSSGTAGATAYRVRWANGGGTAYPVYEVNGLPDHTPDHVGAYGYQIGFTPSYVDPNLGPGGLQLDGSDFVDIDLSTAGIASISATKLSIYGRSYNTTASGSFSWQTLYDVDATPTNFVSNVAPYQWYTADMTPAVPAGTDNIKIRIKAGPNSGSLVVNRIEICMQAN